MDEDRLMEVALSRWEGGWRRNRSLPSTPYSSLRVHSAKPIAPVVSEPDQPIHRPLVYECLVQAIYIRLL